MSKSERRDPLHLVAAIGRGDAEAEKTLVERYGPGLSYVLRRELGSSHPAEDLYQETFCIVLEKLRKDGLEQPGKLAGFVLGVARHLVKAYRRSEARYLQASDMLEQLDDGGPSPCDQAIHHERARALRTAIDRLTVARDRELLTQRYLLERDKQVVCDAAGLEPQLFNRAIHRARRRLRAAIGADCLCRSEPHGVL